MYSNPAIHGALLAHRVLSVQEYYEKWVKELKELVMKVKKDKILLKK